MEKFEINILLNNKSLPDTFNDVDLIETNISWIILTDHYAFKFKRPVKYSFIDYSTVKKRKHYCELEIELNRRLAPDIYLSVMPVTQQMMNGDDTEPAESKPIDYAVQMKRMNGELEMDSLIRQDRVGKKEIRKLAEQIAQFHRNARIIKNAFDTLGFQDMYADILSVKADVNELFGKEWEKKITHCAELSNEYLNRNRSFFNQRIITNHRREGHGDLTTRNIFLYDPPVIFDCIEFNRDYRHIDVLNEIAFLSVDLDFFGKEELSEYFYQEYLENYGEEDSEETRRLFTYYKSYRANVQAKVNIIRAAHEHEESETARQDAEKYLQLMVSYCREIPSPNR